MDAALTYLTIALALTLVGTLLAWAMSRAAALGDRLRSRSGERARSEEASGKRSSDRVRWLPPSRR
jgi:hypothetical protein